MLNGSKFTVEPSNKYNIRRDSVMFSTDKYASDKKPQEGECKLIYLPEGTQLKYIDNIGFSNQVGDGINVDAFGFLQDSEFDKTGKNQDTTRNTITRGLFTPYIGGICDDDNSEKDPPQKNDDYINSLCNIRIDHDDSYRNDVIVRANDSSPFYAVTNKVPIDEELEVYRGDCFTNTVTMRMHRNFVDQTAPIADVIVKPDC